MKAARRVLAYLKGMVHYSIIYGGDTGNDIHAFTGAFYPDQIHGFTDADYAMDRDDRKSQTGYVSIINNGSVSWTSHKQIWLLFRQCKPNTCLFPMRLEKRLHEPIFTPTSILPLPHLRDSTVIVHQLCHSPMNQHHIKDQNTSMFGIILSEML